MLKSEDFYDRPSTPGARKEYRSYEKKILREAGRILGSIKTEKKAASSRENGKLGGRPKGGKNAKAKAQV